MDIRYDAETASDGTLYCPDCHAPLDSAGYEHLLVCPSCGQEFDGEQPDRLGEQPSH